MRDSVIYGIAASLVVVGVALTIGMAPKSNSEAKLPEVVAQNMVEVAPPTAEALNTPAKPPQAPERPPLPSAPPTSATADASSRESTRRDSEPAEVSAVMPDGSDEPVAMSDVASGSDGNPDQTPL
jgi:hypothetical protein